MVFSSAVFLLLFLPIVFVINLILPKKFSNIFLLVASLFFYAWGEPIYVLLMIGTIILNWFIGIGIYKYEKYRKVLLALGVIGDLIILGYFKYANFVVDTINSVLGREAFMPPHILLPIGISFFTFQAISYVVDVYRKDTEPSQNIINVALYIAYFPQLIAGPIVKYKEINEQIIDRTVTMDGVAIGFRRFIYGLSKKVIISNIVGKSVDMIFDLDISQVGFKTAWIGIILYGLQLYNDFSGYSDIAIGLGKMFGFDIPENFNYPYMSKSITEIWRRWHISLGTWFREYVYIPLGGSKKGNIRTAVNLVIVFALTGFWHGSSFSYLFFGFYMGVIMVIERFWLLKYLKRFKFISWFYAITLFNFGYAIFRINNLPRSMQWIGRMLSVWRIGEKELACGNYLNNITIAAIVAGLLGSGVLKVIVPEKIQDKWRYSGLEWMYCVICLLLSLSLIASSTYNPFIYFQF